MVSVYDIGLSIFMGQKYCVDWVTCCSNNIIGTVLPAVARNKESRFLKHDSRAVSHLKMGGGGYTLAGHAS